MTPRRFVTLDPTASGTASAPRPAGADRPQHLDGVTLGLLANGKANSVELLEALLVEFSARHDVAGVVRVVKESVSLPPSEDDVARLADECGAVITAIGD